MISCDFRKRSKRFQSVSDPSGSSALAQNNLYDTDLIEAHVLPDEARKNRKDKHKMAMDVLW